MAEYAPQAIKDLFSLIDRSIPVAVNSGIVGNDAHKTGYHRSRNRLIATGRTNDYSILSAPDKKGPGDACSALDVSFPPAEMRLVTKRMIDACKANDPRVSALREILGTLDGKATTGWNRVATGTGSRSKVGIIASSAIDSSHLWHVHFSILREFADDVAACKAIAAVATGLPPVIDIPKIVINGVEYDDLPSVSVATINANRDQGTFSRHVYYCQLWLAIVMPAKISALPNRMGWWDAPTQHTFNEFRKSLGWTGSDAVGAVGMTSLSTLAKKAQAQKPVRS